ncbi:MBOAT family O-acyltransferase [Bengtsoniella intestinalis]|uniref:MBOAT family O-acyltransferase n=1 Tax=Bengtsoniella intestinalis TaxID=3073143 RepID=UPI00391F99A9
MNFQSLAFLGLFVITAPICVLVGRKSKPAGVFALLIVSLVAYGDSGLLTLLLGLWVTYGVSQAVQGPKGKIDLAVGIGYHVAALVAFKYLGFFTGGALGFDWAPIGISFFTFSQIWYLKAVYDKTCDPVSVEKLGLYGLFFPTVVSGPILSPKAFFPQLEEDGFLRPSSHDVLMGLYCFGCGLVKKILFADQLALVVAKGYGNPWGLSLAAGWLVILGFTLQLYLDFSGYCDMATGVARMLGIRLPVNFNAPYRATSITDFWKRWHITLTSFLRECIYLPLGGNRKGTLRTYGNILLIFLISGLWHGAGWTFIFWGLLHGLGQVAERLAGGRIRLPKWLGWAVTFAFVNVAWVLFRAPSVSYATGVLWAAVGRWEATIGGGVLASTVFTTEMTALRALIPAFSVYYPLLALIGLYAGGLLISLWPRTTISRTDAPKWYQLLGLGLLVGWCILSFGGESTFIYANF